MSKSVALSVELKTLLDYIKEKTVVEFPIQQITLNYLILSILDNQNCDGYLVLSKCMLNTDITNFKDYIVEQILLDSQNNIKINDNITFTDEYESIAKDIQKKGISIINSALMLEQIIINNNNLLSLLSKTGVTKEQLHETVIAHLNTNTIKQKTINGSKTIKRKNNNTKKVLPNPIDNIEIINNQTIITQNNLIEKNLTNLNSLIANGLYNEYEFINCDKYINQILYCFNKLNRRTVILVGESGVGKTSIVNSLAKQIYYQKCPTYFKNKYIMKLQDKLNLDIINEMNKQQHSDKYIIFIDDFDKFFIDKEAESLNEYLFSQVFEIIPTIVCMSTQAYTKHIQNKPNFCKLLQKINVDEPSSDELFNIIRTSCKSIEKHNNVSISDDVLTETISLTQQYITNEKAPASILNVIDLASAHTRINSNNNSELNKLETELNTLQYQIQNFSKSGSAETYDLKDTLIRQQIDLQKKINKLEIELLTKTNPVNVTLDTIKTSIANITNIPITKITENEKEKLRNLYTNLTNVVIGQDEAVSDICQAIKRQRIGLSNPNKPCVILSIGSTGTGKTFLVKRLAHEMFGSENKIIRLDMSEYSEKTSVTKLYGASAGYIGYEEGGILTESVKKHPYSVLLLDEIEKAHPDVYNIFLQIFDEGRLTDNKGNMVSFKNVIIFMTSNVGAEDVLNKASAIGFTKNNNQNQENKEIILKSLKKTFKPEFINRIDNICFFKKLSDENIQIIIQNEIKKVEQKVNKIGYSLDDDIINGKLIENIFNVVKEQSEYGARPILREIQNQLENKITDFIINNDLPKNYKIKFNDIYN